MLTKKEVSTLSLSPTKKDFVQIWNELLEVAGKLSERWDPTSTNESDPGIVILKVLTGIADKLNYNIDKNILEAFMPTAAQEDSMRKLCEMLGYSMKYYRSAQTEVTIRYYNAESSGDEYNIMNNEGGVLIPRFTVLTNNDQDIYYFTINKESRYISNEDPVKTLPCMEGQIVRCEGINDNYVITINQISDNNRFYLPEIQVAENGIFINNIVETNSGSLGDGAPWTKVDNLNTQTRGSRVFKFGYDSYESRPYVEFPDDYSELFGDGVFIYYARTSGVNGNISRGTLTQLELPNAENWDKLSAESFSVINSFPATSGADIETITQAYNSFKKTVGTFETLVTCRDYMNKIYSLMNEDSNSPYVSNVLVTDIRSDINRANIICSCDGAGIFYKECPVFSYIKAGVPEYSREAVHTSDKQINPYRPVFAEYSEVSKTNWWLASDDGTLIFPLATDCLIEDEDLRKYFRTYVEPKFGDVFINDDDGYWHIVQNIIREGAENPERCDFKTTLPVRTLTLEEKVEYVYGSTQTVIKEQSINHFDLVLYPFKTYTQVKGNVKSITSVYDNSFTYSNANSEIIKNALEVDSINTISHNIVDPREGDIVCINNYLRLDVTIATHNKITVEEGTDISENIRTALANAFNMRELDFGEEIPFDSIVSVIEKADNRIKVAALSDPAVYTTFSRIESIDNENVEVKEYAVASQELTEDFAEKSGRFDMSKDDKNNFIGTFNSDDAKKIYNKLAVRNILAGRIPLFNYNEAFKTSFSESAYQVSKFLEDSDFIPEDLPKPNSTNPYTVFESNGKIYTGLSIGDDVKYTVTETPELYADNVISEVGNNSITDISATCTIEADSNGCISDVTLEDGEFVRFRAPNFKTLKTYPAYVNYHLDLNRENFAEARAAKAKSLFEILSDDLNDWSESKTDIKWQKVLNYFKNLPGESGTSYVQKYELSQKVSKYNADDAPPQKEGVIELGISNSNEKKPEYTLEELLMKSGCIKLTSPRAKVYWDPEDNSAPASAPDITITLINKDGKNGDETLNPFVTSIDVVSTIQATIDDYLNVHYTDDKFPSGHDWYISFEFECVPFEAKSLTAWETFIKSSGEELLGFNPVQENGTIFWRIYGDGYNPGKYITDDTQKLLKFNSSYFGLLPNPYLDGIYLVEDLGEDTKPRSIENDAEYELADGEFLYIEYTPSTTTDDGATQEQASVTEIYEKGTIIRPSGFDGGLIDSQVYNSLGNSPHKTVNFSLPNNTTQDIEMYRFGANEQVEIRDYDRVILDNTFGDAASNGSIIYVYKNFNCDELENIYLDKNGRNRINNSYILKDGEYIFYTDSVQTDYGIYSSGTEVELTGNVVLERYDIIDVATILDLGTKEIPWKPLALKTDNDKVIFTSYQFVTLGAKDKIETLKLQSTSDNKLSNNWQPCDGSTVVYWIGGDKSNQGKLPDITVGSDGWEVCSIYALDVSPSTAQTLRKDGPVTTSLKLSSPYTSGGEPTPDNYLDVVPDEGMPLSFKTNLACQAANGKININDVYLNVNKLTGFELKIFASNTPVIVETAPGRVVPNEIPKDFNAGFGYTNFDWPGTDLDIKKGTFWNYVDLEKIQVNYEYEVEREKKNCDKALRLSPTILPNTYGIFCIYLDYSNSFSNAKDFKNVKTWIEVIPGTDFKDLRAINTAPELSADYNWEKSKAETNEPNRFLLKQGINCLRINKSSKLFIKTSEGSRGTLYFDELKLVDCSTVTLVNNKNEEVAQITTEGLNLDQIGYLLLSGETSTSSINAKTQDELVESAVNKIDKIKSNVLTQIDSWHEVFEEYRDKVEYLSNTEKNVIDDLKSLKKAINTEMINSDDLKSVFGIYNDIMASLSRKKTLEKALIASADLSSLKQELAKTLESLSSVDTLKQQLTDLLTNIKNANTGDIENIPDDLILEDYNSFVDMTIDGSGNVTSEELKKFHATVVSEIIELQLTKIDAEYTDQLTKLHSKINNIANLEARAALLALLNDLKVRRNSPYREKLTILASELSKQVDISIIEGLLSDIASSAAGKDYVNLITRVTSLLNNIQTDDLKALIAELETSIAEGQDDNISDLIAKIKTAITNSSGSDNTTLKDIVALANSIISVAQGRLNKSDGDPEYQPSFDMVANVTELRNKILKDYRVGLSELITEIESTIEDLDTTFDEIVNTLQDYEDTDYISNITATIKSLITQRNTDIAKVKSDTNNQKLKRSFPDEVVLSIWPKYVLSRFNNGANQVYKILEAAINNNSRETGYLIASVLEGNQFTSVLDKYLGKNLINDFCTINDELVAMVSERSAHQHLIKNLASEMVPSASLKAAFETLTRENNSRELILSSLISKLISVDDVREQTALSNMLELELAQAIKVDEDLIAIIAKYCHCPTILSTIEYLDDSSTDDTHNNNGGFYYHLNSEIETIRQNLKNLVDLKQDISQLDSVLSDMISLREPIMRGDSSFLTLIKTEDSRAFLDALKEYLVEYASKESWLPRDLELKTSLGRLGFGDSFKLSIVFEDLATYVGKLNLIEQLKEQVKTDDFSSLSHSSLDNDIIKYFTDKYGKDVSNYPDDLLPIFKDLAVKILDSLDLVKGWNDKSLNISESAQVIFREAQLLKEIRDMDPDSSFYYNAPIDPVLAIDLNVSDISRSSLMSSAVNYDINNVNNNFVISKLDMDYLASSIKLARSSRLN